MTLDGSDHLRDLKIPWRLVCVAEAQGQRERRKGRWDSDGSRTMSKGLMGSELPSLSPPGSV